MRRLRVRCPGWQERLTACGLACLAAANANGLSLTDPAGDAYESASFSDIVEIEASKQAGGVLWTLEFVDLSQGVSGALLLDLDGNRRTGGAALSQITEAAIDFNVAILGICTAQLFTASGAEMLACSVEGNRLTIALPSTSLAPDPQTLEFAAVAASDFLCGGRDRIPDEGYARFRDGQVDVQAQGAAPFTAGYLTDPVDAAAPVDLRGVEVAIEGEHLVLRTRYHNPIDPFSIDVVTQGMLSLDLDRDLLTGFQGTSEVFPTFGVDAYVQYYVYPWALGGHTEVTLGVQDPRDPVEVGKLQVGSFFSDSCFRRLADGVEVAVPLARLPAVTGRSVVVAQTLEPVGDLWDRFPDAGGLVALDGAVIPFNACRSPELGVADPAGDSYAFGGDNDDLLGLHACYYDEGLLFRVRYTSLDLLGEALTSMSVDIDRSLATGEPTDNASSSLILGAEYTLVSALSSNPGGARRGAGLRRQGELLRRRPRDQRLLHRDPGGGELGRPDPWNPRPVHPRLRPGAGLHHRPLPPDRRPYQPERLR